MNNEMTKNMKQGGEKLRIRKPQSAKRFMKLLEVKAHYHEIEVCHMSNRLE